METGYRTHASECSDTERSTKPVWIRHVGLSSQFFKSFQVTITGRSTFPPSAWLDLILGDLSRSEMRFFPRRLFGDDNATPTKPSCVATRLRVEGRSPYT